MWNTHTKKDKRKKIWVNNNNNINIIKFLDNLSSQVSFFDIRSFIITISSQKTSSSVFHSFIRSKWNRFGRSQRVLRAHWAFSSSSSVTQPTAASQSVWLLPHWAVTEEAITQMNFKKTRRREWKGKKLSAGNKTVQRNSSRTTSSLQNQWAEKLLSTSAERKRILRMWLRRWNHSGSLPHTMKRKQKNTPKNKKKLPGS